MAQRWMQAKLALARTHGLTRSGAGRAMGDVFEDRHIGWVDPRVPGEPSKRRKSLIRDVVADMKTGATVLILKPKVERQRETVAPVWKRPRGVAR